MSVDFYKTAFICETVQERRWVIKLLVENGCRVSRHTEDSDSMHFNIIGFDAPFDEFTGWCNITGSGIRNFEKVKVSDFIPSWNIVQQQLT